MASSDFASPHNATDRAGALLREQLLTPSSRSIWEPHQRKDTGNSPDVLSVRAIARAISAHQDQAYGLTSSPDQYKDRVWRALVRGSLSHETIQLFSDTFSFSPDVTEELIESLVESPHHSDTSNTVEASPQVIPISSFYSVAPSPDPGWMALEATVTLSALESGCDHITFYQPGLKNLTVQAPDLFSLQPNGPNSWRIIPTRPYLPLQVFTLRVAFLQEVRSSLDGSGRPALISPFNVYSPQVSVRYSTGGALQDVRFTTYTLDSQAKVTSQRTIRSQDFCSNHYPALEKENLEISWESVPDLPQEPLPRLIQG